MTRDEAAEKLRDAVPAWGSGAMLVDSLVALGMLKLDEPKSAEGRLIAACTSEGFAHSAGQNLVDLIGRAGLKIVEK